MKIKADTLGARLLYLCIALAGIAIDQISKLIVVLNMDLYDDIPLWEGVLHIRYIQNPGAAFGILADAPWVFTVFSTVAIVGIGIYLFIPRVKSSLPVLYGASLSLILSGGIGNMIDRLRPDTDVIDFIYFKLIDFAIFNIADAFVCIGAALLFLLLFRDIIRDGKARRGTEKDTEANSDGDGTSERLAETGSSEADITEEPPSAGDGASESAGGIL